jgi:hypothetical protein
MITRIFREGFPPWIMVGTQWRNPRDTKSKTGGNQKPVPENFEDDYCELLKS